MTLGEIIKKYRKANNLSTYQLAKTVGISHSYINQIEQGKKKNPDINILAKITIELSIPFEDIIKIKLNEFENVLILNEDISLKLSKKYSLSSKLKQLTNDELNLVEVYVDKFLNKA